MTVDFRADTPLMRDYIRYLFHCGADAGTVRISTESDFGRLLVAHVRTCGCRPDPVSGETVLTLEIGLSNATQSLADKWLYYQEGDMRRLNGALKSIFNIDLYTFFIKADGLGCGKKEIVEAFIRSRGLVSGDPYDALHKRIYRIELDKQRQAVRLMSRKIYYLLETVDMGGLECHDKNSRKNLCP